MVLLHGSPRVYLLPRLAGGSPRLLALLPVRRSSVRVPLDGSPLCLSITPSGGRAFPFDRTEPTRRLRGSGGRGAIAAIARHAGKTAGAAPRPSQLGSGSIVAREVYVAVGTESRHSHFLDTHDAGFALAAGPDRSATARGPCVEVVPSHAAQRLLAVVGEWQHAGTDAFTLHARGLARPRFQDITRCRKRRCQRTGKVVGVSIRMV